MDRPLCAVVLAGVAACLAGCGGGGGAEASSSFDPLGSSRPSSGQPSDGNTSPEEPSPDNAGTNPQPGNGGGNPPPDDGDTEPELGGPTKLTLTWEPSPEPVVIGYHVYYDATPDRHRMELLTIPAILNLATPSIEFDILRDLGALPGQDVCFRVKAYSLVSESDLSQEVCAII